MARQAGCIVFTHILQDNGWTLQRIHVSENKLERIPRLYPDKSMLMNLCNYVHQPQTPTPFFLSLELVCLDKYDGRG